MNNAQKNADIKSIVDIIALKEIYKINLIPLLTLSFLLQAQGGEDSLKG